MAHRMYDYVGGISAIEEEEDTSQHGESSGKDKEKDQYEHESQEEEKHHEGLQDPPRGDERSKEFEKMETKETVIEKRKQQGKASTKIKKNQKGDKMKDITPMLLNDGNLEQIRVRIQEVTTESCNKV